MSDDRPADQPPPARRKGLDGRTIGGRYEVVRTVAAGANTLIADAYDSELDSLGDDQAGSPGAVGVGGLPAQLPQADGGDGGDLASQPRRRLRLGRGADRPPRHRLRGRRVPVRRQPARPLRPRPPPHAVAGADGRPGSLPWARLRPSQGARPHRADTVQAGVRRRPPAAHRRLRAGPHPRRAGLEGALAGRHPRGPLRVARTGRGQAARRPHRRLLAGPDPRRGGHRHGALRRRLDRGHALGPHRQADAGVGRPRCRSPPCSSGPAARKPAERFSASQFGRALVRAAEKLPRPTPIPILVAAVFEDPSAMRAPNDPTGGINRPPADVRSRRS